MYFASRFNLQYQQVFPENLEVTTSIPHKKDFEKKFKKPWIIGTRLKRVFNLFFEISHCQISHSQITLTKFPVSSRNMITNKTFFFKFQINSTNPAQIFRYFRYESRNNTYIESITVLFVVYFASFITSSPKYTVCFNSQAVSDNFVLFAHFCLFFIQLMLIVPGKKILEVFTLFFQVFEY